MSHQQLFHIIWTTYNEYPVWDESGSWQKLTGAYAELQRHHINFNFSRELPVAGYLCKKPQNERLLLNEQSIHQLKTDIKELCRKDKDRIINGLDLEILSIGESKVEILAFSDRESIIQKISRLKSRTSTLLSFSDPEKFTGKGTWGKGFWHSTIFNKEELAISIIKNFSRE